MTSSFPLPSYFYSIIVFIISLSPLLDICLLYYSPSMKSLSLLLTYLPSILTALNCSILEHKTISRPRLHHFTMGFLSMDTPEGEMLFECYGKRFLIRFYDDAPHKYLWLNPIRPNIDYEFYVVNCSYDKIADGYYPIQDRVVVCSDCWIDNFYVSPYIPDLDSNLKERLQTDVGLAGLMAST